MSKLLKERIEIDTLNGANLVGDFFDSSSDRGIFMLPGITEHRGSLYGFAQDLNKTGFKVWVFDLNSQGESSGKWDIQQMQESAHYIQEHLKKSYGLKKIGAFGNSAGGMAVGLAASRKNSGLECLCLTGTPSSVDEFCPNSILKIARYIPQPLVKLVSVASDKMQADLLKNANYQRITRPTFKTETGYQPYAQFGALKVPNLKEMIQNVLIAPRLIDRVREINQPTLLIYGGEDGVNGIKGGELPENIKEMYNLLGSKDKRMVIVPGASHALSTPPIRADDSLNQDPKYSWVKNEVRQHFGKYLL